MKRLKMNFSYGTRKVDCPRWRQEGGVYVSACLSEKCCAGIDHENDEVLCKWDENTNSR
jgi:hypothetical protein